MDNYTLRRFKTIPIMENNFLVRDYRPSDFTDVNNIWEITGMGGKARGDDAKIIDNTLRNGAKLIILEDTNNNKPVGTSWLTHDYRRIYLHHFGILPEYQGKGLSKLLLDESLAYAKKEGMQIKLEVHKDNEIALNIYKKAGFKFLGDYHVYIIRDLKTI